MRPLLLLEAGRREEAAAALRRTPVPPGDLLTEAMWALTGRAAIDLGDKAMISVASGPIRLGAMPNSRSIRLGPAAFNRAMKDAPRNL